MIFINSRDDPLVPENLLIPIQNFARMLILYIIYFFYASSWLLILNLSCNNKI